MLLLKLAVRQPGTAAVKISLSPNIIESLAGNGSLLFAVCEKVENELLLSSRQIFPGGGKAG